MIFRLHEVFMLEILALVASTFLLMLGNKQETCKIFYKLVASLGIVASLLTLGCSSYHAYQYAKLGILQMHGPLQMKMGIEHALPKPESKPLEHGCMP